MRDGIRDGVTAGAVTGAILVVSDLLRHLFLDPLMGVTPPAIGTLAITGRTPSRHMPARRFTAVRFIMVPGGAAGTAATGSADNNVPVRTCVSGAAPAHDPAKWMPVRR